MAMWRRTSIESRARPGYPCRDWIETALAGLEPDFPFKKTFLFRLFDFHSLDPSRSIVLSVSAIPLVNCTAFASVVSFGTRDVIFSP